jgi:hypothetical protein
VYCGFLHLVLHVASVGIRVSQLQMEGNITRDIMGPHIKYAFDTLSPGCLMVRTHMGQLFRSIGSKMAGRQLVDDIRFLLNDSASLPMFDTPVLAYNEYLEHRLRVARRLAGKAAAIHTQHDALIWLFRNRGKVLRAWPDMWPPKHITLSRLTPMDWVRGLVKGKDFLSDRDSVVQPQLLFGAMHGWDAPPPGRHGQTVHVEHRCSRLSDDLGNTCRNQLKHVDSLQQVLQGHERARMPLDLLTPHGQVRYRLPPTWGHTGLFPPLRRAATP